MQKVKLIKRNNAAESENPPVHSAIAEEPKVNSLVETVKDWVEQNRALKVRSPRKQFTALFSS